MIYDVDFDQFAETQAVPDKRKPRTLAWLRALLSEIGNDNSLRFNQYKLGSVDPAYTAGTYTRRDVVIFNGGVYESKVDGNTSAPTDLTKWRKISDSFIGTDERIGFRVEKLVAEYAINKWFGTVFRQPTGVSDIFFSNNSLTTPVFVVGVDEVESSDIFSDHSSEFIIDGYSFALQYDFSINVPTAFYVSLGVAADSIIRNFADKYVAAGIHYNIVQY